MALKNAVSVVSVAATPIACAKSEARLATSDANTSINPLLTISPPMSIPTLPIPTTTSEIVRSTVLRSCDSAIVDDRSADRDAGRGIHDSEKAAENQRRRPSKVRAEGCEEARAVNRRPGNGVARVDNDIAVIVAGDEDVVAVPGSVEVPCVPGRNAGRGLSRCYLSANYQRNK